MNIGKQSLSSLIFCLVKVRAAVIKVKQLNTIYLKNARSEFNFWQTSCLFTSEGQGSIDIYNVPSVKTEKFESIAYISRKSYK